MFGPESRRDTQTSQRIEAFSTIFRENRWGSNESLSGLGSALESASVKDAVRVLDAIIRDHGVTSILDVPCGDFYWMPLILGRFPKLGYIGLDIVPDLIDYNKAKYPDRDFRVSDVCADALPCADLIFCKDLLLHLAYKDIALALANFRRSGSRYLVVTSNEGALNHELVADQLGAHRNVNLVAAPFNLPPPFWNDNYLYFWRLQEIPEAFFKELLDRLS